MTGQAELFKRAGAGDREALGELFVSEAGACYAVARRLSDSAEGAEEICQEACAQAVRSFALCRGADGFRPWLLRLVVCAAAGEVRARGARAKAEREHAMNLRSATAESGSAGSRQELREHLETALAGLEGRFRLPIVLCYEQGLTQAQAAEVLDLPPGTVAWQISEGMKQMRDRLKGSAFAATLAVALAEAPPLQVPASLAAKLKALALSQPVGASAAAAAAKGGMAMKVIAGVVVAGVLAGTVAMVGNVGGVGAQHAAPLQSSPAAASATGANPVTGRQDREEVFEFAQKPTVKKEGDKVVITFASKGKCDATVAIVDGQGKVVRHLASGVLGKNAPWPFKQDSLSQSVEWDGKDDAGKPAPAGCKVRVGLGLKAAYDKSIAWEPRDLWTKILTCDREGNVYAVGHSDRTDMGMIVLDRQGQYVRTIVPFPATVPPEKMPNLRFSKTADGRSVPVPSTGYGALYSSGPPRQGPGVTPDGKQIMVVSSGHRGPRYLLRFATDGSIPPNYSMVIGGGSETGTGTMGKGSQDLCMAVSPDGEWIYFGDSGSTPQHVVCRAKLADLKSAGSRAMTSPSVFAGEQGKPGSDDAHFDSPRGVACDAGGNVYVSDLCNNRIQVFSPEAKLLRSIPCEKPDMLAVHPKTGAIYVLRVPTNRGDTRVHDPKKHALVKLDKDGKQLAEFPLKPNRAFDADHPGVFCLDAAAEEPVLWVADANGIQKLADRGGKLERVLSVSEDIAKSWPGWGFTPNYLKAGATADPYREEIYIPSTAGWLRVDGRSGKLLGKIQGNSINEMAVGPDRLIYARMAWAGPALVRFDPESGKPVPFPKGRETCRYGESYNAAGWKPRILGQETNCAEIPTIGGGRTFQDGFCVAPNGDIYVIATEAHGNIYDDLRKLGQAEKIKKQDRLGPLNFLVVYAPDGSMKHLSALPGLLHSNGIHVGRNGNVYVSMAVKPSGQKEPDGIAAGQPSHGYWGSLLCFGSSFDKFPLAAVNSSFEGKLEGKSDFHITNGTSVKTDGLRWHYGGVMPSTSASGECVCANSRFGFDGFDRSFVPAMQTYNVNVLDSNGNLIVRIGGYGNADSRGKDSPVVDPKTGLLRPKRADDPADLKPPKELSENIGFRWAPFVTVTDEAVYALDYAIRRVIRCTLGYAAEETVPLP